MSDRDEDEEGLVDLCFCIGKYCMRVHGVRLATYRGTGRSSRYIVCDECYSNRLTAEERLLMVEVRGAARVRYLGIHALHLGRLPE